MQPEIVCFIMLLGLIAMSIQATKWYNQRDAERLHNDLLKQEIEGLKMDNEILRDYIKEMQEAEDITLQYQLN